MRWVRAVVAAEAAVGAGVEDCLWCLSVKETMTGRYDKERKDFRLKERVMMDHLSHNRNSRRTLRLIVR